MAYWGEIISSITTLGGVYLGHKLTLSSQKKKPDVYITPCSKEGGIFNGIEIHNIGDETIFDFKIEHTYYNNNIKEVKTVKAYMDNKSNPCTGIWNDKTVLEFEENLLSNDFRGVSENGKEVYNVTGIGAISKTKLNKNFPINVPKSK